MAKKFRVLIQGIKDAFEVEAAGRYHVASIITQNPQRFKLDTATDEGIVGVENIANGKSVFFKLGAARTALYPLSPARAAMVFAMAGL